MFRINTKRILGQSKLFVNLLCKEKNFGGNFIKFESFNFSEDKKGKGGKGGKSEGKENKEGKSKGDKNKGSAIEDKSKGKEQLPQKNEEKAMSTKETSEFSKTEIFRKKVALKNEKYEISHNYEKKSAVPKKEKQSLENLVTQLLRNEEITSSRANEIKQEIRDPMNNAYGRYLNKIESRADTEKYIKNFSDLFFYQRTFNSFDRLIKYQRELRDEQDPAYIQIRSQHKLVKNEDMKFLVPETKDVRQNVNSPDWLKMQPRMTTVGYSYNIEENKEFHRKFSLYVAADQKKTLEKQKLMKYIKLNPNDQQVRLRFMPKLLPDGVTPQMIPDYDVDITGYKPDITKKSRKKYKTPRVDTDFKNYEAWRTFDRVYHVFSEENEFLKVDLIPKLLINRFASPGHPQQGDFTGMMYFEDENLDLFLIGDYMQTQQTWGPNYTDEFYAEQEKTVKPEWRLKKWPTPDQFWESTEPQEFRIYYSRHSQVNKFKRWLKVYVNYFDSQKDKTIDQILDEKFGKFDDYTEFDKQRKVDTIPAIHHFSPKFFMDKEEKSYVEHDPLEFPKYISPKDGELFDYEEYMKEEAKKGLKREKGDSIGEDGLKF